MSGSSLEANIYTTMTKCTVALWICSTFRVGVAQSVECLPHMLSALGSIPQHCTSQVCSQLCLPVMSAPRSWMHRGQKLKIMSSHVAVSGVRGQLGKHET